MAVVCSRLRYQTQRARCGRVDLQSPQWDWYIRVPSDKYVSSISIFFEWKKMYQHNVGASFANGSSRTISSWFDIGFFKHSYPWWITMFWWAFDIQFFVWEMECRDSIPSLEGYWSLATRPNLLLPAVLRPVLSGKKKCTRGYTFWSRRNALGIRSITLSSYAKTNFAEFHQ